MLPESCKRLSRMPLAAFPAEVAGLAGLATAGVVAVATQGHVFAGVGPVEPS